MVDQKSGILAVLQKKSNDNNRGTSQLDKKGFIVNYKSSKPYYPPECSYWPIDKK